MAKTRTQGSSQTAAKEQLKWVCKRSNCGLRFKHRTELYRHKKGLLRDKRRNCLAQSPKKELPYRKVEDKFQCLKCEKLFTEQTNAKRHTKRCENSEKEIHQCKFCNKQFKYRSGLKRHEKIHNGDIATPSMIQSSMFNSPSPSSPVEVTASLDDSQFSLSHENPAVENQKALPVCDPLEVSPLESDIDFCLTESTGPSTCQSSCYTSNGDAKDIQSETTCGSGHDDTKDDDSMDGREEQYILFDDESCDNIMLDDLCSYLRNLHKSDSTKFKTTIINMFGTEKIANYSFQYYLATKLDINYPNFKKSMQRWLRNGMVETRGRPKLTLEIRQAIYNTWLDNAQTSTDNRNNRCQVKISLEEYQEKYEGLVSDQVELHHLVNRRGRKNVAANRMIATTTVRGVYKKLKTQGINVALGSVLSNKPFFITYATEKELSLCLCKLCINMTFLFEPLMAQAKKDGDETFESISTFFMQNSTCSKAANGYYTWTCVNRKCKECRTCLSANLKCTDSNQLVSVDQFETVVREYNKLNRSKNKIEKKKTKLTDRVTKEMTYQELYKKILSMRKTYMIHKYFVYNDKYQWPKILSTVPEYGEITHSDYSENMSQLHKREAQSCHFNKKPYSLHCTVEHVDIEKNPSLKSPYRYIYHLSDSMKHNYAFTSIVANHCVDMNAPSRIVRKKSDNCVPQYKCANVFGEAQTMAKRINRPVLLYYGPAGHGKGLVDAMSAFGVKGPLLRKVLTEDFTYNCADDICRALKTDFEGDNQKLYFVVSEEEILAKEETKLKLKIPGVVKHSYHMICFNPSGKIVAKTNLCSCNQCLLGKFDLCTLEKGVVISHVDNFEDDCETDSDIEYEEDDNIVDGSEDLELYELRRETVLEITKPGYVVALFVPRKTVLQSFYLCRVISIEKASSEDMLTKFKRHPFISEGATYLKCQYFEKKPGSELSKNGTVIYKPQTKIEYALPTHVLFPQVNHTCIGKNIILTIQEYNWICDTIPQIDDANDELA